MRCWASFAVSVAVLIGQPYYVAASSPTAAQISAASEETSETASETPSRPARYSVGDKKVAKKLSDTKVARSVADDKPSSSGKVMRQVSDSKVARHVGDDQPTAAPAVEEQQATTTKFTAPKAAVPLAATPQPMPQPTTPNREKVARKLSDDTAKRNLADAKVNRKLADGPATSANSTQVVRTQSPAAPAAIPGPKPATVEKVAAAPLPKPIAPRSEAKRGSVSRQIVDARTEPRAVNAAVESSAPIGSGVAIASTPARRSLSAPAVKVEQTAEAKPMTPKPAATFATPAPATVAVAATPPKVVKSAETLVKKVEPQIKAVETQVAEAKPTVSQPVATKPATSIVAPAPAALVAAAKPAVPANPIPAVMPVPVAAPAVKETVKASLRETTAAPNQIAAAPVPLTTPSTPVRRSFSVHTASQNTPTPAARPAVPQPEPDGDIKSASDAPPAVAAKDHGKTQASIVDGDYCPECEGDADCENCKYGLCDLHKDFKVMARTMYQHHPYEAHPWTYYYFRPYNFRHVEAQQQEAAAWGADPNQPYARKMFDKIYADLEKQMAEKEADAEDGK